MAQAVLVKATFQVAAGNPLKLHLSNFDGSNDHGITLPQSGMAEISLENDRAPVPLDDTCDDGVARDFALFYLFSTTPPVTPQDWKRLSLPHVKFTVFTPSTSIATPECEAHMKKLVMSHPICAMAAYAAP
jgi:hypothetical protein